MKKPLTILLLGIAGFCQGQIPPLTAVTNVYTGTGLNAGNGDTAPLAFSKINTNTLILSNTMATIEGSVANVQASAVTNDPARFSSVPVCTNLFGINTNSASRANALSFLSVMNVFNNPIGRGYGQKKVLFIGDSMSDPGYSYYSTAQFMDYFLRTTYGNNGNGLNVFDQSGAPALSRSVGQSLFPNNEVAVSEVGDSPPLEMSQGDGSQNTVNIGWSMTTTNPINYEAVWYMQWPFGGNFTVTNYNAVGANTVGLALNSYSASTTNLVYAVLPVGVTGTGNSLHFVSTSGTNVICGGQMASTNTPGVETFSYAWDGHGQLDQLGMSSASFTTFSNSIVPDWIIFHEKNNDSLADAAYISNTIVLISQFTNSATKVLLVGTPDMVGGSYASVRGDMQYAASLMGWYYIDLSQDFNNVYLMSSNGYFADGVEHPSAIGAEQWAVDLMMRMQQLNHDQTNYGSVNLPNLNNNVNANNGNVKNLWMYNSGNDSRDGLLIGGNVNSPSIVATANTEKFGAISGLQYTSSYSGGGNPSSLSLLAYDANNGYTLGYLGGAPGYASPDYWDIVVSGTLVWQIQSGGINDQGTHFFTAGGAITAGGTVTAVGGVITSGTHTPAAVNVTGSPFTFVNTTGVALECYTSDAANYSVKKNGAVIYQSLSVDGYILLQTNCVLTLTYSSTAPTLYTNSW